MRRKYDHAKLSQSACLLEGLCICLMRTGGDFAVIIHSYPDCANVLPRGIPGQLPGRFFCTNLRESDVMAGTTTDRLSECIKLVAEVENPVAIYVFGSCLSELIGDDIESVAAAAAGSLSTPVIAVTSSGLDDTSQKRVIDRHAELMYCAAQNKPDPQPLTVNLIGLAWDDGEIEEILAGAGIGVNVHLNEKSPLSDWCRLPAGALNVVIDKDLYSNLMEKIKKEVGTPFMEVPIPTGVAGTDSFFMKIAGHFKRRSEMKAVIDENRKEAADALSAKAADWKGLKLAYNIGTERNYVPYITAKNGLCEVNSFRELGFDVTLLIQGSPEADRVLFISRLLDEMKITADFDIFVDNVSMTPALRKKAYDLVYCVGAMAEMVSPAKVPMIALGSLLTGYRGCLRNLALIENALADRRE